MKPWKIQKTSIFEQQINEQVDYYVEEASERIANRFIDEIEYAISKIARNPFSYNRFIPSSNYKSLTGIDFRKKHLHKFPFTIYYQISTDTIILRLIYRDNRNQEKLITKDEVPN